MLKLYNSYWFIMKLIIIAILLIFHQAVATSQLVKFTLSSYILPDKKLQMLLDVSVPRTPNQYPAIIYMTGMSGLIPTYVQQNLVDSIAEQGYVFMTVSKLQSPTPDHMTSVLASVMAWINENMQLVLNNRVPGVIADLQNRMILMSHSAAGHVTTQYLNNTCGNVKLQILLDPVDGADPFGIKKDYIITPGKMLPYALPVLVLATELDNVKKNLQPACAPSNTSNGRFYDAMSGPKWFLNVSKYGHIDFFNNQYRDVVGVACSTCHSNCNFGEYRILVKQVILSFIDAILYKSSIALSIIQDAKLQIPTQSKHNYMGYDIKRGGFCERVKTNQIHLSQQR